MLGTSAFINWEEFEKLLEADETPKNNYEKFSEFALAMSAKDPCSPAYAHVRKHLGAIAYENGDMFTAAFNFQESLAPALRTYQNFIFDKKISSEKNLFLFELPPGLQAIENELLETDEKTDWKDPLMNSCFKDYKKIAETHQEEISTNNNSSHLHAWRNVTAHKYLNSTTIEKMKQYNDGLPSEWTILQIIKAPEILDITGPFEKNKLSKVPIYLTLFSGDDVNVRDHKPLTVCLSPNKDPNCQYVLSELLNVLHGNLNRKIKEIPLSKYWSDLKQFEDHYSKLLSELNEWIGSYACLFLGKLQSNLEDYELICKEVDNCLVGQSIADRERILLHHLAIYCSTAKSFRNVTEALSRILPGTNHKEMRITMQNFYRKIWGSTESHYRNLQDAERGPVILIVDEYLDQIPWEILDCLQKQPVCRVQSLHQLHALYYRHKNKIRNGYFEIDKIDANFVLNPGQNLVQSQTRMSAFANYWLKSWNTLVGKAPTNAEYKEMLQKSTVFAYAGHGGGSQYLSYDALELENMSCVAILYGCSSVTISKEGCHEGYGLHLSYHIAGSPCIIGNLWTVTDTDCDRIMARILSTWIPGPKNVKHFIQCNLEKWNDGIIDPNKKPVQKGRRPLLGPLYTDILTEADLLKVLSISRGYSTSIFNTCAVVARGIPVKLNLRK